MFLSYKLSKTRLIPGRGQGRSEGTRQGTADIDLLINCITTSGNEFRLYMFLGSWVENLSTWRTPIQMCVEQAKLKIDENWKL